MQYSSALVSCTFTYSSTRSFIQSVIHSFIDFSQSFISSVKKRRHPCIHHISSIQPNIYPSIHFIYLFIFYFLFSFICMYIFFKQYLSMNVSMNLFSPKFKLFYFFIHLYNLERWGWKKNFVACRFFFYLVWWPSWGF